jgi:lipoprotein-releasing system ATP-binding protein
MIQTKDVTFNYTKNTHFKFPDINCNSSEVLLVTGNSGVGKTTLLHILGGMLTPNSGEIHINNQSIYSLTENQRDGFRGNNVGIILQQNYFLESLTVLENVVAASYFGKGKKEILKAKEILNQLGLESQINKKPTQLSLGQQQRVSITRALINQPKVILADEPTSSLDDENTALVADLLENLAKEYKTAMVIVTHDSRLKNRFLNQIQLV